MWGLPPRGHTSRAGAPPGHSITATSTTSSFSVETLGSELDETGVQGGCGADHMDVGSRRGADALQGGIGRGRKGEVFRVSVLGAGAGTLRG